MRRLLTGTQKMWRLEARSWGLSAAQSIRVALDAQHEADQWQQLAADAKLDHVPESQRVWQLKADQRERDAVRQATKAAHYYHLAHPEQD